MNIYSISLLLIGVVSCISAAAILTATNSSGNKIPNRKHQKPGKRVFGNVRLEGKRNPDWLDRYLLSGGADMVSTKRSQRQHHNHQHQMMQKRSADNDYWTSSGTDAIFDAKPAEYLSLESHNKLELLKMLLEMEVPTNEAVLDNLMLTSQISEYGGGNKEENENKRVFGSSRAEGKREDELIIMNHKAGGDSSNKIKWKWLETDEDGKADADNEERELQDVALKPTQLVRSRRSVGRMQEKPLTGAADKEVLVKVIYPPSSESLGKSAEQQPSWQFPSQRTPERGEEWELAKHRSVADKIVTIEGKPYKISLMPISTVPNFDEAEQIAKSSLPRSYKTLQWSRVEQWINDVSDDKRVFGSSRGRRK